MALAELEGVPLVELGAMELAELVAEALTTGKNIIHKSRTGLSRTGIGSSVALKTWCASTTLSNTRVSAGTLGVHTKYVAVMSVNRWRILLLSGSATRRE